ncbi:MAG: ATP-binding cassette domain-containing protein, partial [Duodenibacillus sp.]
MMNNNVLEVSHLTVRLARPRGRALDVVTDVGFSVQAGRCLAIVGESGCGKSITALSVMGLLPEAMYLASGSICVDGLEVTELTESEMQRVRGARAAMIFQEPATSLNPVITVGEQIAEAVRLHRTVTRLEARRAACAWLDRVGLGADKADRFAHELSGGQKQRVMIAMALACEPRVLVADEPTT